MAKYFVLVLFFLVGSLSAMYFWIGVSPVYPQKFLNYSKPHLVYKPEVPIDKIEIYAFYFVPKNKIELMAENWRKLLENNLEKMQKFHSVQFSGRSRIEYQIYPEPIIGFENNLVYDTDNTQRGNPKALIKISEELEKRVFREEGDLFSPDFPAQKKNGYPVLFIVYEGVGAIGGVIHESELESIKDIARSLQLPEDIIFKVDVRSAEGFFMVSRAFLTRDQYVSFGASIAAHEFYHTLGIPDEYDAETAEPFSEDIMGLGRLKPIEKTFLSMETLRGFGL